jgi:hypothetical protein
MLRVTRFCVETIRHDSQGRELREVETFYTHRAAVNVVMMRHRRGLAVRFWEVRGEPTTGLWKRPRRLAVVVGNACDQGGDHKAPEPYATGNLHQLPMNVSLHRNK